MKESFLLQEIQIVEKNYGNLKMIFKNNQKWKVIIFYLLSKLDENWYPKGTSYNIYQ